MVDYSEEQAGTGPGRRHIQGSKIAKRLPSVKYSLLQYSKIENFSKKTGPNGALKSHNAEKLAGDPLSFFNIHSVAKHEKIEENKKVLFSGKNLTMPKKTERGDPLGFFNIHSVAKHQKNAGGPFGEFFFRKKSLAVPKKNERTLWSRPVWYVTRQNRKNLFGSVR